MISYRFSVVRFLALGFLVVDLAAAVNPKDQTDPQRFLPVQEWTGTLATGAESAGEREDSISRTTYGSSIKVQARFQLTPFRDPKGAGELQWRGRGEAIVRVRGQRKVQYKDESITDTFAGDYVDAIEVTISNLNFAKGTYQLAVIRDRWQLQPHRGKAIEVTSVKRNRYGSWTTVGFHDGHAWNNDAGAGFGRETPLPKKGFVVQGSLQSRNDDLLSQDGSVWNTAWTIRPVGPEFEEPLKAVAGGPYTTERGKPLVLDGLMSTGRIRSYTWKFEPADPKSDIPFNAGATKDGRRVNAVLLAPVKATLTVSDGKKEDSDTVILQVTARDYTTPFVHRDGEKVHPRSIAPRHIKKHDLTFVGGENVCALDDYFAKDSIHVLHPAPAASSWETRGYTLKQVDDTGGPFHGDWYVDDYKLRIEREVMVNKYILPNGPPPVSTAKKFYAANQEMGHDVDAYLAAVRRHERLHSTLIQAALPKQDPGPRIEALASKDKAALKQKSDQLIQVAEDNLSKATEDPLPSVGYKGIIAFPDDATDRYLPFEMLL